MLEIEAADRHRNPTDYLKLEDAFSPVLHHVDQAVRFRASNPLEPVPPPHAILTKYSKPPQELIQTSRHALEKLKLEAAVKKGSFHISAVPLECLPRRSTP